MTQQKIILKFIQQYQQAHGTSPTRREIAAGCALSSTSVVTYHLEAMARAGLIEILPDVARGIRLAPFKEDGNSGPLAHLHKANGIIERLILGSGYTADSDQLEQIRMAAMHLALAQRQVELKVKPATVKE